MKQHSPIETGGDGPDQQLRALEQESLKQAGFTEKLYHASLADTQQRQEAMITDTTPEAEKRQNQIFARLSGEQKVRLAMELSDMVRDIAWAGFCQRHPLVSGKRLRAMFFKERYGIEPRKRSKGPGNE
jgi:hypothetical protein